MFNKNKMSLLLLFLCGMGMSNPSWGGISFQLPADYKYQDAQITLTMKYENGGAWTNVSQQTVQAVKGAVQFDNLTDDQLVTLSNKFALGKTVNIGFIDNDHNYVQGQSLDLLREITALNSLAVNCFSSHGMPGGGPGSWGCNYVWP